MSDSRLYVDAYVVTYDVRGSHLSEMVAYVVAFEEWCAY